MSRATKSVVFAGEDSEGEESDDDEWLDDVSDTPRAGDAPERDDAAGSFPDSPSGTPRESRRAAGSLGDGDAATFAESAAVTGALDAPGIPRTRLETPTEARRATRARRRAIRRRTSSILPKTPP